MKSVLLISGFDPSGGAGLLADARVAVDHNLHACGVITALTVQNSLGVQEVVPVAEETFAKQLHALLTDVHPAAIKIGMLGNETVVAKTVGALGLFFPSDTRPPVVWDPVLRPSRGEVALYSGNPLSALAHLLPLTDLLTPNIAEAEVLAGTRISDVADMEQAAKLLGRKGNTAILIKGGHIHPDGQASAQSVDVLFVDGKTTQLAVPRLDVGAVHGAGCLLSTAIMCQLAHGVPLALAVVAAQQYVHHKLQSPLNIGDGLRYLV